jgi:hypothetical protein
MADRPELKPFDKRWLDRRGNFYSLVTPDVAAELMSRNTNNRSIKKQKITQYAHDMGAGKWNPDASDIKFDANGELIDGQNRLLACIQADVPFPTLVRTGLDPEAFTHIDTGAVRTTGDVFKRAGVTDYFVVASAVSLRARYESIVEAGQTIVEKRLPLTRQEALDYLHEHPSVQEFATFGRSMAQVAPSIQRAVWLSGVSMFAERDEDLARRVAGAFVAGDAGSFPQLVPLMRYAMSVTGPKVQDRKVVTKLKNAGLRHLTALVKTWNAIRTDTELVRLTVREDETPEPAK